MTSEIDYTNYVSKHSEWSDGSVRSARSVLPIVRELVPFDTVIDVGCGLGNWASVCTELGASRAVGVDGAYVDKTKLRIPQSDFFEADLENPTLPPGKFDLAISLEVAEHITEGNADNLVNALTNASDVVLFSAAIPGQKGEYHVNEQWPSYWAAKFQSRGYSVFDCIRLKVWDMESVEPHYAQNSLLMVKTDTDTYKKLTSVNGLEPVAKPLSLVHPTYFAWRHYDNFRDVKYSLGIFREVVTRRVKRKLKLR